METKKTPLHCDTCNFTCMKPCDFNRHLSTQKHISLNNTSMIKHPEHKCNCGKMYKSNSGLWKHKKICEFIINKDEKQVDEPDQENIIPENSFELNTHIVEADEPKSYITNEKMCEILKEICISNAQNAEFQKQNAEFQAKFFEFMKEKQVSNITNNNNNNIQINIDTFLNQCCDGAMSLNNFIKNLQVSLEDVFYMASHGNKNGIVAVITRELDKQTLIERPFHCTDAKRHITYVKEEAGWIKTQDQKPLLNLCYQIQHKCAVKSNEIFRADPRYAQSGTKETEVAVHILIETNGGRQGYEHNHGLAANILENKYHVNKEQMKEAIMK